MLCSFCGRQCKNKNSLRNHERLCKENPNRQQPNFNLQEYKKRVADGEIRGENQHTKAHRLGEKYTVSDETRKKLTIAGTGRKHNSRTKEKLSVIRSKFLEEIGGGGFTSIKHYEVKNSSGVLFKVRGTWEKYLAEWLTENKINWVRRTYLSYTEEGVKKTYTPDFFLPERNIYLEVKGYYSEKDKQKMKQVVLENSVEIFLIQAPQISMLKDIENIENLLTKKVM
jgi:hypothetical protein